MGYAYDTVQTQICSPGTKLIRLHTRDADITLSVWRVNRCGVPQNAWPRIPRIVDQGFAKKWLAARCQRVYSLVHGCPSQGLYSLSKKDGYHEHGWSNFKAWGCTAGLSRLTYHDGDSTLNLVCVVRYEQPRHQIAVLPVVSDLGLLI